MGAVEYLTTSYYEHWLHSIVERGVRNGRFTRAELEDWERRIAAGEQAPTQQRPGHGRGRPHVRPRTRPGPSSMTPLRPGTRPAIASA